MGWFISQFNETDLLTPGQELIIPLTLLGKGGLTPHSYQTVPVLAYHKFSKDRADAMTVTESAFEMQMAFLKENGYHVVTMDQFFDFLDFKVPLPEKSVVITIDDGWRSVYDIAFPILRKYGYPATLFVYTDFIHPTDRSLDWHLIREMSGHGMDVQCHTKTHRKLLKGNQESFRDYFEALKKELTESAAIVKRNLNKDVKYLAYPFGDTHPLVIALLMKLGYRGAFTVERESNPFFVHPYRLHRSMIFGSFDLQDFQKNLNVLASQALR